MSHLTTFFVIVPKVVQFSDAARAASGRRNVRDPVCRYIFGPFFFVSVPKPVGFEKRANPE
jgi:hypothetical protein